MAGEKILVIDDSPTIRKVVEINLRRAGYRVESAEDGQHGLEVAERVNPDLILLDFVMPRMNGFQFCQALRGISNFATVPIVLMSAKGDKIGEHFVQQMGAVDSITKPFSPDALLAVTSHVLGKYGRAEGSGRAERSEPVFHLEDEDIELVEEAELPMAPEAPAETEQRDTEPNLYHGVGSQIAARLVDVLVTAMPELSVRAEQVEEALVRHLTPKALASIVKTLSQVDPSIGTAAFTGDLGAVPLAEVLQLLALQGQSGCLEIRRDRFLVQVCFREGLIDLAMARGGREEFLLGRYLAEEELVPRQELEVLVRNRTTDAGLLGEQLVKLGYISREDLSRALSRQTSELLYEVLRWTRGRFAYTVGVSTREAEMARLGIPVGTILLEGFRRVDEWRLIEREIEDFDTILVRDEAAVERFGRDRLTREEQTVLDSVDGRRAVREIIDLTQMGSFLVCKLLFRLLSVKLVQKRA